nr:hypothetical protein [Pseudomonas sp. MF7451]
MAGATIGYDPHGPDVVMASDFDNATRLFLDAAERCIASERREKELQQRLTAADERADVLEVLVGEVLDAVGREPLDLDAVLRLRARMRAALKPAEGVGDDTTLEEDREDFKKVFVRINTKQGQSISLADMIARYEKKP